MPGGGYDIVVDPAMERDQQNFALEGTDRDSQQHLAPQLEVYG